MTEVRITAGYDINALLDEADGPVVWTGKGAETLGLTGEASRADLERIFSRSADADDDEPLSLLDQMRRDGTI